MNTEKQQIQAFNAIAIAALEVVFWRLFLPLFRDHDAEYSVPPRPSEGLFYGLPWHQSQLYVARTATNSVLA